MHVRSFDAPGVRKDAPAPALTVTQHESAASAEPAGPSDPGQIVEVDTATQTAREQSAAESAREQRYNELLRTPAPASSAPAPSPKEPSFLQRVVTPIANALGLSPKPQQTPAPVRPAQKAPGPRGAQTQVASESAGSREDSRKAPAEPDDPESDTKPPQLLGASFNPAQVADGETTQLTVIATDDLSGVRSISGVVAGPSGALEGFACQKQGDGDHYLATVRVPKDAAEGVWAVRYLTLTDNASNSVNVAAANLPGTASFRVSSSRSDTKGPVLKAVWLDRQAMRGGERNTIFIQADDDVSGVNTISGVFVSPQRQARIGFGAKLGGSGAFEAQIAPPRCVDCGTWTLEQIQLQDNANNTTTVSATNDLLRAVTLDISGDSCDGSPPALTSLTLSPPVVSNADASVVNVVARVDDSGCGVSSLNGQVDGPAGAHLYFSFAASQDGQTFTGAIRVPQHAAKGTWTISSIQALDKGHNMRSYPSNDPVIAKASFQVQ